MTDAARDASAMPPAQPSPGPLAGIRVVEMGSLLAGPFCGQLLGDLGAEVLKIEPPGVGDPMRQWGREKPHGQSLWWPVVARNKKSVTVNLRTPQGQDLVRRLVATSDVVVENFRPGTLERWNLGYEALAGVNPRLVLTRVTGFGQSGPYSPRAGYGSIGEAMGGIRYVTGDADRPPSRAGISLGDSLAATYACIGTLAALTERERSGRGQVVDAAIYEAVLAMMESLVTERKLAANKNPAVCLHDHHVNRVVRVRIESVEHGLPRAVTTMSSNRRGSTVLPTDVPMVQSVFVGQI